MKMCIVNLNYVDLAALQNLNGSKFKTRAEAVEAVKRCAYTDLFDGDPEYESELEIARAELVDSFAWYESLAAFADELNEFDPDGLVTNHAFVALDWETDK